MKALTKIFFLFCAYLAINFQILYGDSTSTPLALTITVEKDTFLIREAIYVTLTITNTTSHEIEAELIDFSRNEYKVIVKDNKNNIYPAIKTYDSHSRVWKEKIKALDYFDQTLNMGNNFAKADERTKNYLPAGDYTVRAFYTYHNIEIESNEVQFTITEPQGEEKEALTLFALAFREADRKRNVQLLDSLVQIFPHSVYRPSAILELITISGLYQSNKKRASEYAKRLLDEYPTTCFGIRGFHLLTTYSDTGTVGKKNTTNIIEYVQKKYPGTKLERSARRLKEIKNKE